MGDCVRALTGRWSPTTTLSEWTSVFTPDGDGLAGIGPTTGVAGNDVLLARVTLQGLALGLTPLAVLVTAGDLTEGFPLVGTGNASPTFVDGSVEVVVPEPSTAGLMLIGLLLLAAFSYHTASGAQNSSARRRR